MKLSDKKTEILDLAQQLMQKRGYNGFSYADIAETVGIRKASIHHHFPSKEALALAVVQRYKDNFYNALNAIAIKYAGASWLDIMQAYGKLHEAVLHEDRLCLCGMLASDMETLPEALQQAIQDFFEQNAQWIVKVLVSHKHPFRKPQLKNLAWQIISSLQGAIMIAKLLSKPEIFTASHKELFLQLANIR
jgi:TetR/AcrR family transcriptional repressor of nem operon